MISWTSFRNQRSMPVKAWISLISIPFLKASPINQSLSGVGVISLGLIALIFLACSGDSKPEEPISKPRMAFCSDSLKLEPMAITSPTDFI